MLNANVKSAMIRVSLDADWANDRGDRRSITGGIIRYAGCPVAWVSRKQDAVALSTADAEYRAIAEVVQRAIYTSNLATTLHKHRMGITFETDNQPALSMISSMGNTTRSKFIDIRHHYLKEQIKANKVNIVHVKSEDQGADIFTKPMGRIKFLANRKRIGVEAIADIEADLTDRGHAQTDTDQRGGV